MIGLPDAEVKIKRKTLSKTMRGKHAIEPETLKQLPQQINNPVGIFQSSRNSTKPAGYVVLTELTEFNKEKNIAEPIITALHLDKDGEVEMIRVASSYGKKLSGLQGILNENKAYYWNKEKGSQLVNAHELQLPLRLRSNANLSASDIKTESDLSQYRKAQKAEKTTPQTEESDGATRFSRSNAKRKRSALEIVNDPHPNRNPSLLDRLTEGGYKNYAANVKRESKRGLAYVDKQVHDRLRPVMDWIEDLDVQGLTAYRKRIVKDSIYRAEGIRHDLITRADNEFLNPIRKKLAKLANEFYQNDGEKAVLDIGYWISARYAIDRRRSRDYQPQTSARCGTNCGHFPSIRWASDYHFLSQSRYDPETDYPTGLFIFLQVYAQ